MQAIERACILLVYGLAYGLIAVFLAAVVLAVAAYLLHRRYGLWVETVWDHHPSGYILKRELIVWIGNRAYNLKHTKFQDLTICPHCHQDTVSPLEEEITSDIGAVPYDLDTLWLKVRCGSCEEVWELDDVPQPVFEHFGCRLRRHQAAIRRQARKLAK